MNAQQDTAGAVSVPFDRIVFDERFQMRQRRGGARTQRGIVVSYAHALRSEVALPPITLIRLDNVLYCADGWHRSAAHQMVGAHEIVATIVDVRSVEEGQWIAAKGNIGHGLRLHRAEEFELFKRYVRARQHRTPRGNYKPYREMAADLGGIRTHTTVRNWMRRAFPKTFRAIGEDGPSRAYQPEAWTAREQQERLRTRVTTALKEVRTVLPGIAHPEVRGELIAEAEALLGEMREGGPWVPPRNTDELDPF